VTAAANGRPAAFDLDAAAEKAAADSNAAPFAFTYRGESYEAPAALSWPLEAQRLIGLGELEPALGMLLGDDQFARLVAAGITVGELSVLFEAIGEAAGVGGLPNSPRPARRASTRR
jgi:hypothetical protein